MRFAPYITFAAAFRVALAVTSAVAVTGVVSLASADHAEAQTTVKKRNRVEITRRSYLDPGNVVKPGSRSYLDYALPPGWFYPGYGQGGAAGPGPITGIRWPLPGQFDLPGF
ncbi:hypothetical protein V5F49_05975 [Xanthobacter sp. V3C-3]|uniref:hypothetical protein n=1 Tax=Xanthobacter lutulentifluminis TaxID=3119935 RepID=UPI00372988EC